MGLIDRAILQDEINQALNALFRNGQLPYIKTSNGLTFDGDTTGKEVYDDTYVKISDTPVKAEDVTAVFLFSEEDGKKYAVEEMAVVNEGDKVFITGKVRYDSGGSNDGVWVVIVNSDNAQFTKGVYVVKMGNSYVCEIHGIKTETIHPIDLNFIPVALLPVSIELSVILPDSMGDIVDVPKEEGDRIMEAFQNGISNIWITAKSKAGREYLCRLSSLCRSESGIEFVFDAGQFKYSIAYVGGGWKMALGATNP